MTNVPYLKPVPASGERPKIKSVKSTVRSTLEWSKRNTALEMAQQVQIIFINSEGNIEMVDSGISQPERLWLLEKAKQQIMDEDPE
jgi:hypothetical protein